MFARMTEYAHHLIAERVKPGETVIDATVGNGYDTLFLAEWVGENGRVYGFDIQEQAIRSTYQRLKEAGQDKQVTLICAGHQHLDRYVIEPVRAVMFNLGYLPGSDKKVITTGETTIAAVEKAVRLLVPGGLITIVVYPGHEGGLKEKQELEEYVSELDQRQFLVCKYEHLNRKNHPPFLLAVEKRTG